MTDEIWDSFVARERRLSDYLFLEPHKQLVRQWEVKGEDATFTAKLDGAISRFGAVSVFDYEDFAQACAEQGYSPIFMEDPSEVFAWRESLNVHPGVEVNSKLDGRLDRNGKPLKLVGGFLKFQAQGVNFAKHCERAVYYAWSTGTGKTLAAEGNILWRRSNGYGPNKDEGYDLVLYCNKPGNLFNAKYKLKEHTDLDSRVLIGTPAKRKQIFAETAAAMQRGEQPILILNAEKFREDTEFFKLLVENKRVLVIFDEMPTKFANRSTALYRAAAEVFYTSFTVSNQGKSKGKTIFYPQAGKDRPAEVFYVAMSATPIRNSPEDFFNSVRFMDSRIFGSIDNFNNLFVAKRDPWGTVVRWKNLDLMGAMAAHIVHMADKETNPEIKAQFPAKLPDETVWCDLDPATEKLYSKLQDEYANIGYGMLDFDDILAAIAVLQMIVDNPRAVLVSAEKYERYLNDRKAFIASFGDDDPKALATALVEFDKKNRDGSEVAMKFRRAVNNDALFTDKNKKGECVVSKLLSLRDEIESHDDKVIVFSDKNDTLLPFIAEWFDQWGITYVTYHGGLSPKGKQEAQDKFRNDPSVKVFLSTDAGQDSIDLPEASLTIHYNDPWTNATKVQRGNRQDRIDSDKDVVQEKSLYTPGTVEDRRAEIIMTKKGYQNEVNGEIAEQSQKMNKRDFYYMLTGRR